MSAPTSDHILVIYRGKARYNHATAGYLGYAWAPAAWRPAFGECVSVKPPHTTMKIASFSWGDANALIDSFPQTGEGSIYPWAKSSMRGGSSFACLLNLVDLSDLEKLAHAGEHP